MSAPNQQAQCGGATVNLEPSAAAAVIGVAVFELWEAYRSSAPSLAECRTAVPGDIRIRQQLMDADMTIGSLALIVGIAFAVMSKDTTVLIILLAVFGIASLWRHSILSAEPR